MVLLQNEKFVFRVDCALYKAALHKELLPYMPVPGICHYTLMSSFHLLSILTMPNGMQEKKKKWRSILSFLCCVFRNHLEENLR